MKREDEAAQKPTNSEQIDAFSLDLDAIISIDSLLDTRSMSRFSLACRFTHTGLKPSLMIRKAKCLLNEVMYANPIGIKKLMQHDKPQEGKTCVVLKKVTGKEACGREWKKVSPLEFAAWAGDTELVRLLLTHYVPKTQLKEALAQLKHLQNNGCEYGKPLAAFDLLVAAYQDFINKFDGRSWEERDQAAVKQIGGAQRQLPGVGLQWFCDSESFEPIPKFDRAPARAYKLDDGYLLLSSSGCISHDLGSAFFIYKLAWAGVTSHALECGGGWRCVGDAAMSRLCEVRRTELGAIIQQLQLQLVETLSQSNSSPGALMIK